MTSSEKWEDFLKKTKKEKKRGKTLKYILLH